MNVTFACSQCEQRVRVNIDPEMPSLQCPACHQEIQIASGGMADGQLSRCVVCPSADLFICKDFPQRIGLLIVAAGIVGSSITWGFGHVMWTFGILFGTALLDVILYALVPNALMCYRCNAQYRGVKGLQQHGAFNLETYERYRQQAARIAVRR
jgi:hypothetical protein